MSALDMAWVRPDGLRVMTIAFTTAPEPRIWTLDEYNVWAELRFDGHPPDAVRSIAAHAAKEVGLVAAGKRIAEEVLMEVYPLIGREGRPVDILVGGEKS